MSVAAIASILIGPMTDVIGKFVKDKDQAALLAHELSHLTETQLHENNLAQIEVNKVEAASRTIFISGWRPAAAWVCVTALANNYILVPYIEGFTNIDIPILDYAQISPILIGMLGLAVARSVEKIKKVAAK